MGLFDKRDLKKRKDDFDSPNESVDLNQPTHDRPEPAPEPAMAQPAAAATSAAARPAPTRPPPPRAAPPPESDNYGIDKAIELMRTLPTDNVQLVVQVVKFSLESVGIKLPAIIDDAIRRQKELRGRVDVLKAEIADHEQEIKQRKDEIERHEADYRETTSVRERLELAEGLGKADGKPEPRSDARQEARSDSGPAPSPLPGMLPRPNRTTAPPPGLGPMAAPLGPPPKK